MTVLRSSLELRGRRLPSTNAAKAKTWVQMLGIGFVALSPIVAARGNLALLFGVPLAGALITMLILRFTPRRRFRPIEFAATVLIGFLTAALLGGAAGHAHHGAGLRRRDDLVQRGRLPRRRLPRAGAVRRVSRPALGAPGCRLRDADRRDGRSRHAPACPPLPLIILLSVDMARGALDNYAANRRVTDFSWAASLWVEIALLVGALVSPRASGPC